MLGKLYSIRNGTSDKDVFNTPGYRFAHKLPEDMASVTRNLFLLRDPKDLLVSSYHQYKYRPAKKEAPEVGTFSGFLRCEVGATKIVKCYNEWYDVWEKDSISGVEFYEDMVADPTGEFSDLMDWFGEAYNPAQLAEVIRFGEFENLRRLSKEQYFSVAHLNAIDPDDERTYKFRVGKVGRGDALIPEEDREYVEQLFSEIKWSRYHD
jgi:hypothetical protein